MYQTILDEIEDRKTQLVGLSDINEIKATQGYIQALINLYNEKLEATEE